MLLFQRLECVLAVMDHVVTPGQVGGCCSGVYHTE